MLFFVAIGFPYQIDLAYATDVKIKYKEQIIEVTNQDAEVLRKICSGTAHKGDPACDFGDLSIIFINEAKEIEVIPASDKCDTMAVSMGGDIKYYWIGRDHRLILEEILAQYQIIFPLR